MKYYLISLDYLTKESEFRLIITELLLVVSMLNYQIISVRDIVWLEDFPKVSMLNCEYE